jgi:WD40 repeat protein
LSVCAEGGDFVTIATIQNRHGEVRAAHVGDSGMIGIASADQTLKFWDIDSGELAGSVEGFTYQPAFEVGSELTALAISPDGTLAISGETNGGLVAWRVENSELVTDFRAVFGPSEDLGPATAVAFSPDGELVATADTRFGGSVAIRHVESGAPMHAGEGVLWGVEDLVFSPDGESVAIIGDIYGSPAVDVIPTAFPTQSRGVWESESLQTEHRRIGARSARWTPDGSRLVVAGDRFVAILNPSELADDVTPILFDDHDPVGITMSPDGTWFATIGAEGDLRFHSMDGSPLGSISLGEPVAVGLAADGSRLAAIHRDGTVELFGCAE